jgi:hypothetical protein
MLILVRFVIRYDLLTSKWFVYRTYLAEYTHTALINFCEGVERDALVLYLDPIVERLLKLLNPTGENAKQPKCYMQEQAIATLAMVANASEVTFVKVIL